MIEKIKSFYLKHYPDILGAMWSLTLFLGSVGLLLFVTRWVLTLIGVM
jgi:hypothetical protein